MMKIIKRLASALLVMALALSCIPNAGVNAAEPKLEMISEYKRNVLGISPDGEKIVERYDNSQMKVLDFKTGSEIAAFEIDDTFSVSKTAVWKKDGSSFILGDSGLWPYEFMIGSSRNLYIYDMKTKMRRIITNENVKESIVKGGVWIYSPSWSADEKGIIYSALSPRGVNVYKVDAATGNKTTLYNDSRKRYIQAIELSNGKLICEDNGTEINDRSVYMYDVNTKQKKLILGGGQSGYANYEVKKISDDRKTILINKYIQGANGFGVVISNYYILTFDEKYEKYQLLNIPAKSDISENKRFGLNSQLFPSGKYILAREDEEDFKTKVKKYEIVLYNKSNSKKTVLYQANEQDGSLFGISCPMNGSAEALYATNNQKLMIWFVDPGYRTYRLSLPDEVAKKSNNVKPTTPQKLKVEVKGTQASLSWSNTAGADYYNVYYKKKNGSYVKVKVTGTSKQLAGLTQVARYYFKVTAVNAAGESPATKEIDKVTGK